MSKKGGEIMLRQESIFEELFNNAKTQKEKKLITEMFNSVQNFYYILDIYSDCSINSKIFNYLFLDSNRFTIEKIAEYSYVSGRTVRRFKKKTEKIVVFLIENCDKYKLLYKILKKHKND